VKISTQPLLDEPESITQEEDPDDVEPEDNGDQPANNNDFDDLFNDGPVQQPGVIEFDDDFWR
jgi:hypothetical protein